MSQLFAPGGRSIGVTASTLVLSMNYSGLISFRMDWLDLLAVQGTPKSLLQHHSSKASILQHSAFFIVQLSYPLDSKFLTSGPQEVPKFTFLRDNLGTKHLLDQFS